MKKQLLGLVLFSALYFTCNKKNILGASAKIDNVCLSEGATGDTLTITGTGFTNAGQLSGTLNNTPITILTSTTTELVATVPAGTPTQGTITIVDDGASSMYPYNLSIGGIAITPGKTGGLVVTITGTGFAAAQDGNTLTVNGITFTITSATSTQIVASTPSVSASAVIGAFDISAQQQCINFGFQLAIDSIQPSSGPAGTVVTIKGTGFSATTTNDIVKFNGLAATVRSATDSVLVVTAPAGGTTGPVSVTVGSNSYSNLSFTYPGTGVTISAINPTGGATGITDTITGTGFDTAKANDIVSFNGVPATVSKATATQLVVTVPSGATSGPVSVKVDGGSVVSGPTFTVNTGSTIFAGGADGYVYALDAKTGALKWKSDAGGGLVTPPVVVNGVVYANSTGVFNAFNAATGATIWSTDFTTDAFAGGEQLAIITGGVELVSEGYEFALDTATGNMLWNTTQWNGTDSSIYYIGLGPDGTAYTTFTSENVSTFQQTFDLVQLNPKTGQIDWRAPHFPPEWPLAYWSDPVYDNGKVFLAGDTLEAFDASSGSLLWAFPMGYPGYQHVENSGDPAAANGIVYANNTADTLFAVNENTGALEWLYPSSAGFTPCISNGVVYVSLGTTKGVVALNASTGSLIWNNTGTVNAANSTIYGPILAGNGMIYVCSSYSVNAYDAATGNFVWQYTTNGYLLGAAIQ